MAAFNSFGYQMQGMQPMSVAQQRPVPQQRTPMSKDIILLRQLVRWLTYLDYVFVAEGDARVRKTKGE